MVAFDMSMKRPGREAPAQQKRISGVWPLFHAVASETMRGDSDGLVRSALIKWNLWEEGRIAAA